jgi:tetratricopeptide (TPR) repeat protein
MIKIYNKLLIFNFIFLFLLLQLSGNLIIPNFNLFAQTDQTISGNLEKAENSYYDGEFNETIKLISLCLKQSNITKEQRSFAYVILSRTFIAMEKVEKAKEFINKILDINPDYLPTIEQETPQFVSLVLLIRKDREQGIKTTEDSGISKWIWIGAGSAITAAVIILIASADENKEKENKDLPEPPEFP